MQPFLGSERALQGLRRPSSKCKTGSGSRSRREVDDYCELFQAGDHQLSGRGPVLSLEIGGPVCASLSSARPRSLPAAAPTVSRPATLASVSALGPQGEESSLSHLGLCRPNSRLLSAGLMRKAQVRKAGAEVLWRLWAKWLSQEFNQRCPLPPGSRKTRTVLVKRRAISQAGDGSF